MPKWFKFFGAVLFLLIAAFAVTNAVFYGFQTDNKDPKAPITSSNATILMWINIVLAILSVFALIYFVRRIYKGDPEGENKLEVAVTKKQSKTGTAAMITGFSGSPATQSAAEAEQNRITQLENTVGELLGKLQQGQTGLDPNAPPLSPTPTGASNLSGQRKGPPVVRAADVEGDEDEEEE